MQRARARPAASTPPMRRSLMTTGTLKHARQFGLKEPRVGLTRADG